MFNITCRNVGEALFVGSRLLRAMGQPVDSRAGPTLEMPGPLTTTYLEPTERVLFYPNRDANPFFHLFEALWMLAGRNDVAWVSHYVKRMKEYSTDGKTLGGAYGHRWRRHFNYDQLNVAVHRLTNYPNDRRTVISMTDPRQDLKRDNFEKDIPCNTHIYLKVRDGRLNMTVCCRSNDMIWGAYGANAVHFSVLQEYLAARIGVSVGIYSQLSDSFHAYTEVLDRLGEVQMGRDPYLDFRPTPMITNVLDFEWDVQIFMDKDFYDSEVVRNAPYREPFFIHTVEPMRLAYAAWKRGDMEEAMVNAIMISAPDWRKACVEWLERRAAKKAAA